MASGKPHDIQTVVNLIAPKEVGVTLVPLESLENVESSRFWASLFLSLFGTIFGAELSLLITAHSNTPVLWLLLVFSVIFLILFICFSVRAYRQNKKARQNAIQADSEITPEGKISSKLESTLSEVGLGNAYTGAILAGRAFWESEIFRGDREITEFEMEKRLKESKIGNQLERLQGALARAGVLMPETKEGGEKIYRLHSSFAGIETKTHELLSKVLQESAVEEYGDIKEVSQ